MWGENPDCNRAVLAQKGGKQKSRPAHIHAHIRAGRFEGALKPDPDQIHATEQQKVPERTFASAVVGGHWEPLLLRHIFFGGIGRIIDTFSR